MARAASRCTGSSCRQPIRSRGGAPIGLAHDVKLTRPVAQHQPLTWQDVTTIRSDAAQFRAKWKPCSRRKPVCARRDPGPPASIGTPITDFSRARNTEPTANAYLAPEEQLGRLIVLPR